MMDWDEDSDEEHPAGSAEKDQVPNNEVNFQHIFEFLYLS